MDTGWATARTLRIVANNLFGRQCSDMSPTSTARTRNREKVSASRSCIEFDLCDTAATAIIQSRAHKLLATPRPRYSRATRIMPIQARSSPYVIVVTVPISLPAQDAAKHPRGPVSKVASNHSRSGSLFLPSSCNAAGRSASCKRLILDRVPRTNSRAHLCHLPALIEE